MSRKAFGRKAEVTTSRGRAGKEEDIPVVDNVWKLRAQEEGAAGTAWPAGKPQSSWVLPSTVETAPGWSCGTFLPAKRGHCKSECAFSVCAT